MLTRSTTTHPPNPHGYSVHHQQHTIISPAHIPVHSRNSARRLSPPIASSCQKGSVGRRRLDKRPFFFLPSFSPFCFFERTCKRHYRHGSIGPSRNLRFSLQTRGSAHRQPKLEHHTPAPTHQQQPQFEGSKTRHQCQPLLSFLFSLLSSTNPKLSPLAIPATRHSTPARTTATIP